MADWGWSKYAKLLHTFLSRTLPSMLSSGLLLNYIPLLQPPWKMRIWVLGRHIIALIFRELASHKGFSSSEVTSAFVGTAWIRKVHLGRQDEMKNHKWINQEFGINTHTHTLIYYKADTQQGPMLGLMVCNSLHRKTVWKNMCVCVCVCVCACVYEFRYNGITWLYT